MRILVVGLLFVFCATFNAVAQPIKSGFGGKYIEQVFGPGENKAATERNRLDPQKKNPLLWSDFPLATLPTIDPAAKSSGALKRAQQNAEVKRKLFVKKYLVGRPFSGRVAIDSIKEVKDGFQVEASQRGDAKSEAAAEGFDVRRHHCVWICPDKLDAGEVFQVDGLISDVTQPDGMATITLSSAKALKAK